MKVSFIDLIRSAFRSRDEKFKQKISIFLVCLGISISVWIVLKMSNVYKATIKVPVVYTQMPKGKILLEPYDSIISLEFEEKGSELFRLKYLMHKNSIPISLKNLQLTREKGKYHGYMLTSLLFDYVLRHQDISNNLVSISPDTLFFSFMDEASKKVPVRAYIKAEPQPQYMQYGDITVVPDSVMVKGPASLVKQISYASIPKTELLSLNQTVTLVRPIEKDSLTEQLTFIPDQVKITVPIENYTEESLQIPIHINNAHGLRLKLFPDNVKITFNVALKDFPKIVPEMFEADVDINQSELSSDKLLKVSLSQYPPYIKDIRLDPEKVEFIILK